MGMFDSIYSQLRCPVCGAKELQEVQTKQFECALSRYVVGDMVDQAPTGDVWLAERWMCRTCHEERDDTTLHPAFVHLVDGFILEVTQEDKRAEPTNPATLLIALRAAAKRATELRDRMRGWYYLIENSRYVWKRPGKGPPGSLDDIHRRTMPKDNADLVERIYRDLDEVLDEPSKRDL